MKMLKYREYKKKNLHYNDIKETDTAAIKYKGKVYKGYIHPDIIYDMVKNHGFSRKELDDNLDIDDFGFVIDDKFVSGDSDHARMLNDRRPRF